PPLDSSRCSLHRSGLRRPPAAQHPNSRFSVRLHHHIRESERCGPSFLLYFRLHLRTCNTQSFPVVCDSPSPGTSWRNRENPAPLRAHVSATIGTETVATLVKVRRMRLCAFSELT